MTSPSSCPICAGAIPHGQSPPTDHTALCAEIVRKENAKTVRECERMRAALEVAGSLVVSWERGRLHCNEQKWPALRDALEEIGVLGWYGLTLAQINADEWERSG